jgi:hypothetical protein
LWKTTICVWVGSEKGKKEVVSEIEEDEDRVGGMDSVEAEDSNGRKSDKGYRFDCLLLSAVPSSTSSSKGKRAIREIIECRVLAMAKSIKTV